MGRHVGGHAHGDTRRTVDEKVGDTGGKHYRLLGGIIVVGLEVHGIGIDVAEHLLADFLEADLGVSHGGRAVAVD